MNRLKIIMQMSITNYMTSIGPNYLIIPAVTVGIAYMAINKASIKSSGSL